MRAKDMTRETYDINRLWIERPDLYDRTKLAKGDPRRLTLPAAKRIAEQQQHTFKPTAPLPLSETAKRIADRYIARAA
jgi:hypothetical protein